MSRRYYHLGDAGDGALRILDEGVAPRRWHLIQGSLDGRFLLGVVIGREDNYPVVERMRGCDDGYPVAGRQVWYHGPAAERCRFGLPAPGRWWREYERYAEDDWACGRLQAFEIDGTRCRVIAASVGRRFVVTAPLNSGDLERWTAQRALNEARIITLNTELASRNSNQRDLPIPSDAESLRLFGPPMPWTMMVPAEDTPTAVVGGQQSQLRVHEPVNAYRMKVALTAHIWRAGPRGGRLIGFEHAHSGTLAGIVTWTGKRDQALKMIASEYENAYWAEYANLIGSD